jgi:hypothetical protein
MTPNISRVEEVVVGPLARPKELGDVPRTDLVGCGRQKLGLFIDGVPELVAPLPDLALLLKDAVHGSNRAKIAPPIEQRRADFPWGPPLSFYVCAATIGLFSRAPFAFPVSALRKE